MKGRGAGAFEVALWVFGIVLIVAGAAGSQWANSTMSIANGGYYCDDVGNCRELYDYALTHTLVQLSPSAVTAGLIALALGITLRAYLLIVFPRGRVEP